MRIAVAGGGGLGTLLALQIARAAKAHAVVVLSRTARPELAQIDLQPHVVDYADHAGLHFALRGVDLVISTVSGAEQLSLINAAGRARVRTFIPAEFEGSLGGRPPRSSGPLDAGSSQARALLEHWSQRSGMRCTVVSCGVFMERFHPLGLGHLNIGCRSGVAAAGSFLVDVNAATALYADLDRHGNAPHICLTSIYDLVRLLVAAIDLGPDAWPRELSVYGDRLTPWEIAETLRLTFKVPLLHQRLSHEELRACVRYHWQAGDVQRQAYFERLLAAVDGRYDFTRATLMEVLARGNASEACPSTLRQWVESLLQIM